ncbi:hypothetical protein C0J52_17569 [Blattella germanica]|nr:hypothetical protein C0J52_17569 [Blattella germanica]
MSGCPIRVSTAHFPPFSIIDNKNGPSNSITITGLDVKIVQAIAKKMDMILDLIPVYDPYPWGKFENETWKGLRGDLLYDEADIAIAGWAINFKDHLLLDDTERYFTDRITWYVPRAKPNPRWASIARVFASLTWTIFFVSIFISAFIYWLLSRILSIFEVVLSSKSKINSVLEAWAIVLGVSVPTQPYYSSLRLYFISWVIYCFGINTVFQAFFTSYLIDPGYEHQVSNVEELVESNLRLVLSVYLDEFFDSELLSNPSRKLIMDSPQQCIDFAASNDGVSTMLSRSFVKSEIDGYLAKNITFSLSNFVEDVTNIHLVMMIQKGSPYVERLNDIIMHLVEAGIPVKILNEIVNLKHYISAESNDYVVMSVSHLESSFTLFAVGIAFGIISRRQWDVRIADQPQLLRLLRDTLDGGRSWQTSMEIGQPLVMPQQDLELRTDCKWP